MLGRQDWQVNAPAQGVPAQGGHFLFRYKAELATGEHFYPDYRIL